jgi:hypothetical protein
VPRPAGDRDGAPLSCEISPILNSFFILIFFIFFILRPLHVARA